MENRIKYLITARFAPWSYVKDPTHETGSDLSKTEHRGNGKDEYPAFGVKYLFEITIDKVSEGTEPKEKMTEKDWEELRQPEQNVAKYFRIRFKEKMGHDFDGEILFIEQFKAVVL